MKLSDYLSRCPEKLSKDPLPSLELVPGECSYCGAPTMITAPIYCAECDARFAEERRRESGNEFRRQAQIALDLEMVRRRVRLYRGVR